jgi:1,4-alpha-glucan branching enzyme
MSDEKKNKGLGATPHAGGVAFRVWAPNAQRVSVIGSFNVEDDDTQPGKFGAVTARLGHLKKLGVNAIQIMPVAQFAEERSWGYNPSHIFSVEIDYGGPLAFKRFVKRAHQQGIAVILDVVYNHLGPSDLDLWQFDGFPFHATLSIGPYSVLIFSQ